MRKSTRKRAHSATDDGIAATKADLTEWVYEQGLTELREDAEEIAGLKGKHEKERTHNHWGSTNGELSFGGRRIQVSRPRVRSKSGEEASFLPFRDFQSESRCEKNRDKPAAKLKSRTRQPSSQSACLGG